MKKNIVNFINKLTVDRSVNNAWLPFLRISIGLYCLIHFISLLPDINLFLSVNGIIAPDIADVRSSSIVPNIFTLAKFFGYTTTTIGYTSAIIVLIKVFSVTYIIALISLILGFFTRISAALATFLHLVLLNSIVLYVYGVDYFCSILLFYCILFPVGKLVSADAMMFKNRKVNRPFANYCLLLIQTHISFSYFIGGFDKSLGINWWNGESVWKAIHLIETPQTINVDFLAKTHVFVIIGWVTIMIELFYALFMNIKKTRRFWLFLVVGMHLSIALFLGLYFFSTFMIILNISIFYLPYSEYDFSFTPVKKYKNDDLIRLPV
jgi:vitamin K-dependent gamma-carboxylase-like protein